MATYAIGDVQGCYQPLLTLLEKIKFDKKKDTLWLTGDLVNRGPASLAVLRFVRELGERHHVVLGNHDLHLLSVWFGASSLQRGDTLHDILDAPDSDDLLEWLLCQPLMHVDAHFKAVLVHAGIAPQWTLDKALGLSQEVEKVLQGKEAAKFFAHMYGNEPARWSDDLEREERLRCIVNYFTRMRFCHADGALDFAYKGPLQERPAHLKPWFEWPHQFDEATRVVFGHWAALSGETHQKNVIAIDTGCVWGNVLTAYRLEDGARFAVAGQQ